MMKQFMQKAGGQFKNNQNYKKKKYIKGEEDGNGGGKDD